MPLSVDFSTALSFGGSVSPNRAFALTSAFLAVWCVSNKFLSFHSDRLTRQFGIVTLNLVFFIGILSNPNLAMSRFPWDFRLGDFRIPPSIFAFLFARSKSIW